MKPGAQRRKTKIQIQQEKLAAQQQESEVAEKIRRFEEMQQQAAEAQQNLHDLGNMKAQIDSMFEQGYIFKQEDGSLGLSQSEDQR
jgi:ribosomal protein S20